MNRGRYLTIPQVIDAYEGVFTERLLRRLVAERRIAFTYAGRRVVFAEGDIEAYLEAGRQEPFPRRETGLGANRSRRLTLSTTSSAATTRRRRASSG